MATKTVKTLKVPGAKMPSIKPNIPKNPKLPQLQSNLSPFAAKATVPKLAKGL